MNSPKNPSFGRGSTCKVSGRGFDMVYNSISKIVVPIYKVNTRRNREGKKEYR